MTNREFYTAVINANVSAELTTFAEEAIKKLDHKNDTRKTKGTPTQRANAELKTQILDFMNENVNRVYTAKELADNFSVVTQKISPLMKQIADTGAIDVLDVKDSKKNKVKGYKVRVPDEEVEETTEEE